MELSRYTLTDKNLGVDADLARLDSELNPIRGGFLQYGRVTKPRSEVVQQLACMLVSNL